MKVQNIVMLSIGHMVTDVNQGVIPVLLPFLIAQHGLSYTAAAGIVFALNISSSLVQPLFGYFADRFSKSWLIPAGVLAAGAGVAFIGIAPGYWSIFVMSAISGIGIAAVHPEAARLANLVAGENKATAMSIFGIGGQLGFAFGPLLATGSLFMFGLKGTLLLIAPVAIFAILFAGRSSQFSAYRKGATVKKSDRSPTHGCDAWGPFSRLTLTIVCRSVAFYGLNTFLPLYWVNVLNQSKTAGGTALTILLASGVAGTLIGGRLADHVGYRKAVLISFISLMFVLPTLILVHSVWLLTLLLVPVGLTLSGSFSPAIVLGQKYLPNRVGFASGVTLGLAISVGGIAAPFLGRVADIYGIYWALVCIVFLPVIGACLAFTLPQPEAATTPAQA
jgi:FSR family fosmidomycin resistance protein-like MFS transporter